MSLMTDKVTSLGSKLLGDSIDQQKLQNPISLAQIPKVKKITEKEPSDVEDVRQKHELSRRNSMKAAAGLLQVKEIIDDLEKIAKERNRDSFLGFKPTKEINPDDAGIGQIAMAINKVLNVYPSQQNVQAAMGFIEMVGLIDDLEDMANDNKEERMGFGSSSPEESPLQEEAFKYANNLRAKISYLLEWIEVPDYMLATAPSKN